MMCPKIRVLLFCAAVGVGFAAGSWSSWRYAITGPDGELTIAPQMSRSALMAQVPKDLKEGEYLFLPSRRSIWVINRTNGRMAVYTFLNNEYSTVQRSRVGQIDTASFPLEDAFIQVSDRNLTNNLWICNVRTGDVQLWKVASDGELQKAGPIATSTDLMDRRS